MKTLVLVEHDGSAIKDSTLATVGAASKLGEVHLLVAGSGVGAVAEPPRRQAGIKVGSVDELVDKLKALGVAK